jgi:Ras-related protein Rab-7A
MTLRGRLKLKVLLLGDARVGKTFLLNQFVNREFNGQYHPTIGADFSAKRVDIDGKSVTLQLWDTAGQERFQAVGPTFYRGTDCCILVYDVTRPASFENITMWRNELLTQLGFSNADDFPFLLLGNKSDQPSKPVQPSAVREYAEMNGGMLFYEVSAKAADNVQTALEAIVRKALEKKLKDDVTNRASVLAQEKTNNAPNGECPC